MKALHKLDRASVTFDDPNLAANAGLMLTGTLIHRLGLIDVIARRVKLRGQIGGANSGIKAATMISGLLTGADCIDDIDVLRAGASGQVCGHELRAPSTIGTWLRAFTWGTSASLTPPPATCWPGRGQPAPAPPRTSRSRSTSTPRCAKPTGAFRQGGHKFTRKHHRGRHPLVAVVAGLRPTRGRPAA